MVTKKFRKINITKTKLLDYLLSETHLVGRSKAKFFRKIGFNINSASLLEKALIRHVDSAKTIVTVKTPYGKKYRIDGKLESPDGRNPMMRSIWMETEKGELNFVTAYPLKS